MSSDFTTREALDHCITQTEVPELPEPYKGKVREVYPLGNDRLGIVVTDRISAFDYIMKQAIPFKGQILNQLAAFSFEKVKDIVATHIIDVPHPNVTIAKKCETVPIEVVVRGYLTGHAWRVYKAGERSLCGVEMPDGLKEHDKFPAPILTPATKAQEGHDEDISEDEILSRKIVEPDLWNEIKEAAFRLFERGTQVAAEQGLILVDTKYEFGLYNGELTLIDEVHTTDSSRYFYKDGYEERQANGEPQKQLSKEFLREWLMEHDFQGLDGQTLPDLPDEFRMEVYHRYAELFEMLTGSKFEPLLEKNFNRTLAEILK
ncbi:MAG: phosphoribosylaminoimidazolesuccinocarboxamide synthase [Gracilimonas sp.]|uniref:phosphoribosylaminoimidazolesuccinocarboxamide synthase n=1 Tax=Gracilimonas sp. TaxID=1974203 RepID=UPI001AFE6D25|nr:phosphoribosylaminoimidazolesuccinocarboxamide synthase [Gracilimonas sp.]MBO6586320.1 phosphoribosylaminoimidazolesuccinocarboxamide synthase [Gracilimonas sp.]MBO6614977.1 phosphoribosylaminoimidazolesuccinocarboxamide synthase [Gracilimonas sp.]